MNKIYNGIMGLVVGDALGVPVEFMERDTFKITDMVGYGTHNQPAGTWSDDSSMTLATVESIGRTGRIDAEDIMNNFSQWWTNNEFTPHNEVFDIGIGTRTAIEKYRKNKDILNCGGKEVSNNGNGALMRILPLAFVPQVTEQDVIAVAHLTHAHEISTLACLVYVAAAQYLSTGKSNLSEYLNTLSRIKDIEKYSKVLHIQEYQRDEIRSTGYVIDTLEAALWCLYSTDNYADCVLTAVNLGDDTDTTAAVAGGLAGILYGCGGKKGIPENWIKQIARKDWIKELCSRMTNIFEGGKE